MISLGYQPAFSVTSVTRFGESYVHKAIGVYANGAEAIETACLASGEHGVAYTMVIPINVTTGPRPNLVFYYEGEFAPARREPPFASQ